LAVGQVLDNLFHDAYGLLDGAYDAYVVTRRDPFNQVKTIGAALIQILSDIDTVLATNQNYLLGVWYETRHSWHSHLYLITDGHAHLHDPCWAGRP
jgi:hypothetical protein